MVDLDSQTVIESQITQPLPDCRVQDFRDGVDGLDVRPHNSMSNPKEGRQKPTYQIAVLVYAGREDCATLLEIPIRVVGPAAEE